MRLALHQDAIGALALSGRDKLTFVIEPDLAPLGAWLEQLIAESLGMHYVLGYTVEEIAAWIAGSDGDSSLPPNPPPVMRQASIA